MKLRTDTIGHFENPTEDIIRGAVLYSGEGAREGDIVKLMTDEGHFLCIWTGQRSAGHRLILRSGLWKLECTEKLSSEMVVDLMIRYLHEDLSTTVSGKPSVDVPPGTLNSVLKQAGLK